MATLEDKILGYQGPNADTHDDIRVEDEQGNEINIDEVHFVSADDDAAPPAAISAPRARGGGYNTGPKGVLQDYAEAKERCRQRMDREARDAWATIKKQSFATCETVDERERRDAAERARRDVLDDDALLDDDKLDEFLTSESFFTQYREQRLAELRSAAVAAQSSSSSSSSRKTFGSCKSVTAREYVDEIDNEDASTFVVVHLYQPHVRACVHMDRCLAELARRFYHTKFLRILSTEAKSSYDDVALPTLIVYRRGELVYSCVRATNDLGQNFDEDDVAHLFERNKVALQPPERPAAGK